MTCRAVAQTLTALVKAVGPQSSHLSYCQNVAVIGLAGTVGALMKIHVADIHVGM
jgi:hypothetical protein